MAFDLNSFDSRQYDTSRADRLTSGLFPDGPSQRVQVQGMNFEPNTRGGQKLKVTFVGLDPQNKGQQISVWLNIENPSKQAQEIARAHLARLCQLCGETNPMRIRGKAIMVDVIHEPKWKEPDKLVASIAAWREDQGPQQPDLTPPGEPQFNTDNLPF